MAQSKQSRGTCQHCGAEIAKNGVSKHIASCAVWKEVIQKAELKKAKSQLLYHLRIQSADVADFWFDVEMNGNSTLGHLDDYLRKIWLECCGHLSEFYFGKRYGEGIPIGARIAETFARAPQITHIYDFGTSSETLIKVVSVREGKPVKKNPIVLHVRNIMPPQECMECDKPAKWLCLECLYEDSLWGVLCDEHAETHPHKENEDPIALVNSPRLGMCGYTGPAKPPY